VIAAADGLGSPCIHGVRISPLISARETPRHRSGGRDTRSRAPARPRVQKVSCPGMAAPRAGRPGTCDLGDRPAAEFTLRENIYSGGGPRRACEGIVDLFRSKGLRIFGPTRACACWRAPNSSQGIHDPHKIPTAEFSASTQRMPRTLCRSARRAHRRKGGTA